MQSASTDVEETRFERLMSRAMTQVGVMIAARFEAIEGKFLPEKPLRPPLGVDGREKSRGLAGVSLV